MGMTVIAVRTGVTYLCRCAVVAQLETTSFPCMRTAVVFFSLKKKGAIYV